MIGATITAFGWKVALIGMAAYRQHLQHKTWPYVAVQKQFMTEQRHAERRSHRVAFAYYQARREARVY